jgi:phosphatidylglycerophosphatase A
MDSPDRVLNTRERILLGIAVGLGTGCSPIAPGTVGSLGGIGIVYLLSLGGWNPGLSLIYFAVLFLIGIPATRVGQAYYKKIDPKQVVIDEIAVMPLVFVAVPITLWTLGLGFLLFRVFDIAKPYPIKKLEQIPGPWGVMLDDVLAAIFAAICLGLLHVF